MYGERRHPETQLFISTPKPVITGNTGYGIQCVSGALNSGADTSGVTGNTLGQVQNCGSF